MFEVDSINRSITMSIGDTGAVSFRGLGYEFQEIDRVLFTLKSSNGTVIMEKACALEDNRFVIYFHNHDTEQLAPGNYTWDLRCVLHPYYERKSGEITDQEPADEEPKIVDGDQVYTPYTAMNLTLVGTVGSV